MIVLMPPHKEKLRLTSNFYILQNIFRYFVENGFYISPEAKWLDNESFDKFDKMLVISKKSFIVEKLQDIPSGLLVPKELVKIVHNSLRQIDKQTGKKNTDVVKTEWNYLGKNEEKKRYFDYLQDFFWRNQDNAALLEIIDSQDLLENNWKIANYSNQVEGNMKIVADFIDQETVVFIENLSQMLDNWDLNPYLIFNDSGNLQWIISLGKEFVIKGHIYRRDNYLYQKIQLPDLT
jgi:hypothetical protein